jgi:hypothetical protein
MLGPKVPESPLPGYKRVQGGFEGALVGKEVGTNRIGQEPHGETPRSTARIARIIDNMVICRTFVRSVFTIITHVGDLSPASHR